MSSLVPRNRTLVRMDAAVRDTPSLRDLATILFKPRETMRRVLDHRDRWTIQMLILAYVCESVNDADARRLATFLPDLDVSSVAFVILVATVVVSAVWAMCLFIFAGLTTIVGRYMGGTARAADIRAALAWALTPLIWSIIYRVPVSLYESRIAVGADMSDHELLLKYLESGAFSIFVVAFILQLLVGAWCLVLASFTIAEALKVSTAKGAGTLAIAVITPVAVIAAGIFAVELS